MNNTIHQIDCHDHLTKKDREYIFEVVQEALAEQGFTEPETIGFNLTAYCTTPNLNPEPHNMECLPEGLCSCCFEGQLRDETSDYVCDPIQGRTITVKDLPCTKCDKCDERFYSPAAARRIEDAVEKLREEMGLEPLLREPHNMDEDGVGCKPQDNDH